MTAFDREKWTTWWVERVPPDPMTLTAALELAEAVQAAERERCAKIAERYRDQAGASYAYSASAQDIASAIRTPPPPSSDERETLNKERS